VEQIQPAQLRFGFTIIQLHLLTEDVATPDCIQQQNDEKAPLRKRTTVCVNDYKFAYSFTKTV